MTITFTHVTWHSFKIIWRNFFPQSFYFCQMSKSNRASPSISISWVFLIASRKDEKQTTKKNQKYCYLTLKHLINPFQLKKLDFMTIIILCPKFNQHNLSGPSSGGKFLLETKKQKNQKAKKRGFIFAWNSRLLLSLYHLRPWINRTKFHRRAD